MGYAMNEPQHVSRTHIDWYEDRISSLKICAVLDDSSRKILAIDEFATINTENTITVVERAIQEYGPICPFRELIMDHGSEFGALIGEMKTEIGIVNSNNISKLMISDRPLHG